MKRWTVSGGFALLALMALAAPIWGSSQNWSGLRGPNFDGSVRDVQLFDGDSAALALGWKRTLGPGYSSLSVADGRVVAMFTDGDADYAAAFEAASGEEIWRYRIADRYAGHDGSHDGPISTPLIAGELVFGLGAWGDLFAVDAATGEQRWARQLVEQDDAKKPHFGFATSPVLVDDVLIVEMGAEEGRAIAGFAAEDGELLWAVGDDEIHYHSPIVTTIGGKPQVVAAGLKNLYGIDAASGTILWTYEHQGDERAMGGGTIIPVPVGDNRVLLLNKIDSSAVVQITRDGSDYSVEQLWSDNSIRSTYVIPAYHDGFIYGMTGRIFTCVDAANGETKWRSREPGDGFPTLVGEHLLIMTKPGTLHVVDASPDGYNELARLDLFDEHAWSAVAFADGHVYARSMSEFARIDVSRGGRSVSIDTPWLAGTGFGEFLAEVEQADDKTAVIDAYLNRQPSFPIIEDSGVVHFVYRGEADDVGIVGDMIGFRREDPMKQIEGTDLFYYSTRLEPEAAVTYGFLVDYEDAVPDPRNTQVGEGLFGEVSWFAMPAWQAPLHLPESDAANRGRLETVEWESKLYEGVQRTASVYVPQEYDANPDRRYPVIYLHDGGAALEQGGMQQALDYLIGRSVRPLIAVFVILDEEDPRGDMAAEHYTAMVATELVPLIDGRYRTVPHPMARATAGAARAGRTAWFSALNHPETFGRVGTHSAQIGADDLAEQLPDADQHPLVVYMDWGTYDLRSPHEAWDLAEENRKSWALLRERGHRPAGGEVPEGFGWACWRGHTDEMLVSLYPLRRASAE